jgi:hypothetical protein
MVKFVLFSVLCLSLTQFSLAQETADSLNNQKDTIHSVKKAVLLSTFIPGSGQIYNHIAQQKGQKKGFWKVPLVYAALGGAGFMLYNNQLQVNSLKTEYRTREDQGIGNPIYQAYTDDGVLTLYNQTAQSRDFSVLLLILAYGMQVADAAVEAHFVNFDISEDLSLGISPWTPRLESKNMIGYGFGVGLHLNFR